MSLNTLCLFFLGAAAKKYSATAASMTVSHLTHWLKTSRSWDNQQHIHVRTHTQHKKYWKKKTMKSLDGLRMSFTISRSNPLRIYWLRWTETLFVDSSSSALRKTQSNILTCATKWQWWEKPFFFRCFKSPSFSVAHRCQPSVAFKPMCTRTITNYVQAYKSGK